MRTRLRSARIASVGLIWMVLLGCGETDRRGTFEVEIEISGVPTPIIGTLILSTGLLEVSPLPGELERLDLDWLGAPNPDSNSCLIIPHPEGKAGKNNAPRSVRLFETQLRGMELALPLEIFKTSAQAIEVLSLQFFADAMYGEVVLREEGRDYPGQILGKRIGSPDLDQCVEALAAWRTELLDTLRTTLEAETNRQKGSSETSTGTGQDVETR